MKNHASFGSRIRRVHTIKNQLQTLLWYTLWFYTLLLLTEMKRGWLIEIWAINEKRPFLNEWGPLSRSADYFSLYPGLFSGWLLPYKIKRSVLLIKPLLFSMNTRSQWILGQVILIWDLTLLSNFPIESVIFWLGKWNSNTFSDF